MNQLIAKVIHIKNVDTLHYLTFSLNQQVIHMLSLELEPKFKIGTLVPLTVKSTHVALSKELNSVSSLDNRLIGTIVSLEEGEILASICLEIEGFLLESIISRESRELMNLQAEDTVAVLINSADISIVHAVQDV